jgi:hypothetical protein
MDRFTGDREHHAASSFVPAGLSRPATDLRHEIARAGVAGRRPDVGGFRAAGVICPGVDSAIQASGVGVACVNAGVRSSTGIARVGSVVVLDVRAARDA